MHRHSARHLPYFSPHSVNVNHASLAFRERALPKSGSEIGPGGRGYPFLSVRFRRIRRMMSTVTTVSRAGAMNRVAEVDHSISLLWGNDSGSRLSKAPCYIHKELHASSDFVNFAQDLYQQGIELNSTSWSLAHALTQSPGPRSHGGGTCPHAHCSG